MILSHLAIWDLVLMKRVELQNTSLRQNVNMENMRKTTTSFLSPWRLETMSPWSANAIVTQRYKQNDQIKNTKTLYEIVFPAEIRHCNSKSNAAAVMGTFSQSDKMGEIFVLVWVNSKFFTVLLMLQ